MIRSKKIGQKKRSINQIQRNKMQWSFVILSSIAGFVTGLFFAGFGALGVLFLHGIYWTYSTNPSVPLYYQLIQAIVGWSGPVITFLATLAIVHEQVKQRKWLHTFICFIILISLWLLSEFIVARWY